MIFETGLPKRATATEVTEASLTEWEDAQFMHKTSFFNILSGDYSQIMHMVYAAHEW